MKKHLTWIAAALFTLGGCGDDSRGNENPGGNPSSPSTCSATNCAGCCFNNTCQAGNTAAACGKAGAACTACGTAQVCLTRQACGVDPESTWRVQPLSARIAATDNGTAWDGDGSAPDVFIAMQCPGSETVTSTPEVQSYTPAWSTGGCTARAGQLLAGPWMFQVWDSDVSVNDTITDTLMYQFKGEDFTEGTLTFGSSGGMTSLTVQLQKQP
jgi:hypothetical protein